VASDDPESVYIKRVRAPLSQDAYCDGSIPIPAILSSFHKLSKKYQDDQKEQLDDICTEFEKEGQKKRENLSTIPPKYRFECLQTPAQPNQELVIKEEAGLPYLEFNRVFPIVMGRAHELPDPRNPRHTMPNTQKQDFNEIFPCHKCKTIWPAVES
jgi:hypothetical protein